MRNKRVVRNKCLARKEGAHCMSGRMRNCMSGRMRALCLPGPHSTVSRSVSRSVIHSATHNATHMAAHAAATNTTPQTATRYSTRVFLSGWAALDGKSLVALWQVAPCFTTSRGLLSRAASCAFLHALQVAAYHHALQVAAYHHALQVAAYHGLSSCVTACKHMDHLRASTLCLQAHGPFTR